LNSKELTNAKRERTLRIKREGTRNKRGLKKKKRRGWG